jgi:nitrogen regulatory protein A
MEREDVLIAMCDADRGWSRMGKAQTEMEEELSDLCALTCSDFSAFGKIDRSEHCIRWTYVHGNRNDRYKRIMQRPGKGLAGLAIRLGRPVIIEEDTPEYAQLRKDDPLMLAELLTSAVAIPVQIGGEAGGVLLLGNREKHNLFPAEMERITNAVERISLILNQDKG